jgi:hypothetical protein
MFLKAEKAWKDSGAKYNSQAKKMREKAILHDQKLKSLTGETFGLK